MQAAHQHMLACAAPARGALLLGRQAAGCEPLMGRPRDTFVVGLYRYICYLSSKRGHGAPRGGVYTSLSATSEGCVAEESEGRARGSGIT